MSGYVTPKTIFHPALNNPTNSIRCRFDLNRIYEKPKIVKMEKMKFSTDILNKYVGEESDHVCKQCSSCHTCR